jgi:hypothetical protein
VALSLPLARLALLMRSFLITCSPDGVRDDERPAHR